MTTPSELRSPLEPTAVRFGFRRIMLNSCTAILAEDISILETQKPKHRLIVMPAQAGIHNTDKDWLIYSRLSALLSGTNVIPAKAGIHNPVSDGIMDPRLRGDDVKTVFNF